MSCLILPRRRYSQPSGIPEIDWSNPVTHGLLYAVIPGDTQPIECVDPSGAVWTRYGSPSMGVDHGGRVINIDSINSAWEMPAKRLPVLGYGTMSVIYTQHDYPTADGCYAALTTSEDSSASPYVYMAVKAVLTSSLIGSAPYASRAEVSTLNRQFNSFITIIRLQRWLQTTHSFDKTIGDLLYADNNHSSILGGYVNPPGSRLVIGEDYRIASRGCNAGIRLVAVWDRFIDDDELVSFYHNPWQIFKAK